MTATLTPPFIDAFAAARDANQSNLCVGLDPEPDAMPVGFAGPDGVVRFCRAIIDATHDLVCAYKPNFAFFERRGPDGMAALAEIIAVVPPQVPVIGDAKRGDIGNTSRAYAVALYERFAVSACTVSPYLGADAVAPLLDHPAGFAFLLCRTSNPGAAALQDVLVDGEPLYARVIRLFQPWLGAGRAGLVIGAQERAAFAWAAHLAPGAPILVPGIGAQGGTIEALAAALTSAQANLAIVSMSRSIIHAGSGPDFATVARGVAERYRRELHGALQPVRERENDGAG